MSLMLTANCWVNEPSKNAGKANTLSKAPLLGQAIMTKPVIVADQDS